MVVQAPPPPAETEPSIEDEVIEDARRRQQRQRRLGALLLSTVAAAALVAGIAAGGDGSGGGRGTAKPSGSSPGAGPAHVGAHTAFAGAPTTQSNGYGVESNTCPLAPPSRYLPTRAGCVTVRRLDMTGDGRSDLVIVYSVLSRRHPNWFDGRVPAGIAKNFVPLRAYIKVVLPDGRSASARIRGGRGSDTAAIDFVGQVTGSPGSELFLNVAEGAGFASDVAYGFRDGRVIPAGVPLVHGGDGGSAVTFSCLPGDPPRLVTSSLVLIGPSIYGWWKQTVATYVWHDGVLVRTAIRTSKHHGQPRQDARGDGRGCASH